jgi:uncharacterized membrane protein YoaK (UPF0700 family)
MTGNITQFVIDHTRRLGKRRSARHSTDKPSRTSPLPGIIGAFVVGCAAARWLTDQVGMASLFVPAMAIGAATLVVMRREQMQ